MVLVRPHALAGPGQRWAASEPGAYLWALLVIALPNVLFAAALLFAVAVLTRSVLASYVGGVVRCTSSTSSPPC